MISHQQYERVYTNHGNLPLIEIMPTAKMVLDVGCGAGDNAQLIKISHPGCKIFGITHSEAEAKLARRFMDECWVFDLDFFDKNIEKYQFDVLFLSHVLEHLKDPSTILKNLVKQLSTNGIVLIAVPNTLNWRTRIEFIQGRFEYEAGGILDNTHLRFFTYHTADRYLLEKCQNIKILSKTVTGSFPLWILRRYIFPTKWSNSIDKWACNLWPNLFGSQVLISAIKQ